MSVDEFQQISVHELQSQMSAMQAALEGNSQSSLFKPKMFNGFPTEDVNEWLLQFERYSKFYSWSNQKRLNAISLLLGGSALAWFRTLPDDITSDFNELVEELKKRFGSQSLEFLFRQELYARKQGPSEPLALYTEDIIRKSQRLSLSDKDMMNIFVNGLNESTKTHVILNQPKTFADAENLARLRDSVSKTSAPSFPQMPSSIPPQEQRIKELEGQVNLLFSIANKNACLEMPQSHIVSAAPNPATNNTVSAPMHSINPPADLQNFKHDIIAAIQTGLKDAHRSSQNSNQTKFMPPGALVRGRNLRTNDGRPICNICNRVGHVARYCWENPQKFQQPQFRGGSRGPISQEPPVSAISTRQFEPFKQDETLAMGTLRAHESVDKKHQEPPISPKHEEEFEAWVRQRRVNFSPRKCSQETQTEISEVLASPENEVEDKTDSPVIAKTPYTISAPSNVLIWGTVLKQPFKLLVDTGAAVTVISERFFHDVLRVNYALTQKQLFDSIKTANGGTVPVSGTASFGISIGQCDYVCDAIVVPNLSYNVVLGRDFLHKHRAVIDVGHEKVTFSENNTTLFATSDFPPITSDVRSATTFIGGSSEVVISALLTSFPSEPVVGLIEGIPKLSDRNHLPCTSTLYKPDSDRRVTPRLHNPADDPVLLHKGTPVEEFKETLAKDEIITLDPDPSVSVVDSSAATISNDAASILHDSKLSSSVSRLRALNSRLLSVPVRANRLKPCLDPANPPIEPSATDPPDRFAPEPTLSSSQLTALYIEKNFSDVVPSNEPLITRPEDASPPEIIRPANRDNQARWLVLKGGSHVTKRRLSPPG